MDDSESLHLLPDKNGSGSKTQVMDSVSVQPELDTSTTHGQKEHHTSPQDNITKFNLVVDSGGAMNKDSKGEFNMEEASITSDDVMRAGGFGARDDIGCFLPVASDSTDFEASLRDAREYEDPQEDIGRPGLGWKEVEKLE